MTPEFNPAGTKVGVYVDVANIFLNGGKRMQYDVLRQFACRDHSEPLRLNAYVTVDLQRTRGDAAYKKKMHNFHSALRDLGYKVIIKPVKWYKDEAGEAYAKANADLDLAVDALLQSEKLDRVLIVSGDGDFCRVVQGLQNKGCRVEVIAADNVSRALREEADLFISAYVIPNLLPINAAPRDEPERAWGEIGSRVRGWCYWYNPDQGFGFVRFLTKIAPGLWLTDTRHPDSPFATAFFHGSSLPGALQANLPSRTLIFEFKLMESERNEGFQAADIRLVSEL